MRLPKSTALCPVTSGPLQPCCSLCITRHPPIAARRKADRADFGAVRQAGAFELIPEESFDEHRQPATNLVCRVLTIETRLLGQEENLLRRRAVAQEVEQEEVVQFVRADQALREMDNLVV